MVRKGLILQFLPSGAVSPGLTVCTFASTGTGSRWIVTSRSAPKRQWIIYQPYAFAYQLTDVMT